LTLFVQQGKQRDRGFVEATGDFHQPVKTLLRGRVEYAEAVQGRKAALFLYFWTHATKPARLPVVACNVSL
jgi:hypothetical protein